MQVIIQGGLKVTNYKVETNVRAKNSLEDSLVTLLAYLTGLDIKDIGVETEPADIGLDSVAVTQLACDLERHVECKTVYSEKWEMVLTVLDVIEYVQAASN